MAHPVREAFCVVEDCLHQDLNWIVFKIEKEHGVDWTPDRLSCTVTGIIYAISLPDRNISVNKPATVRVGPFELLRSASRSSLDHASLYTVGFGRRQAYMTFYETEEELIEVNFAKCV